MAGNEPREDAKLALQATHLEEGFMVGEDRWQEIRRLHRDEQVPIAEIARQLDLDRKTVRRCLKQEAWQPYQRPERTDTLLVEHADFLRERARQVHYSAQVLWQELRQRGFAGSYQTVKRFVQPLRAVESIAERATVRFETPPGQQSQIDWGSVRTSFRHQPVVLHVFVLTLGFSRRGFYEARRNERLPEFLEAHERAFEHFGGHTREHLYDRPRTVCAGGTERGVVWNPTFRSFADYWSFEPRVCRPYRARTKGKVESGVKYVKRNFFVGRSFVDDVDLGEQLTQWNTIIADHRVHGTTHERPVDRFVEERPHLVPTHGHPSFRMEARLARIVAADFLVSVDSNRYSVPFPLIGSTVEVQRRAGEIQIFHHGRLVATHAELPGRHQLRVLPEHTPGPIARNARLRASTPTRPRLPDPGDVDVEVRDLATYDSLALAAGER